MIDTTIYDDTDDTTCYKAVNEEYSAIGEGDIRNVIKDKQRDFVNEIVGKINDNPLIKNIIIVGHHPIINFKLKKDNCNLLNLFNLSEFVYDEIYNKITQKNEKIILLFMC